MHDIRVPDTAIVRTRRGAERGGAVLRKEKAGLLDVPLDVKTVIQAVRREFRRELPEVAGRGGGERGELPERPVRRVIAGAARTFDR